MLLVLEGTLRRDWGRESGVERHCLSLSFDRYRTPQIKPDQPTVVVLVLPAKATRNPDMHGAAMLRQDSYASRLVSTGMVVSKINGVQVDTMAEYRDAFWPRRHLDKGGLWTLETEDGHTLQVNFLQQLEDPIAMSPLLCRRILAPLCLRVSLPMHTSGYCCLRAHRLIASMCARG